MITNLVSTITQSLLPAATGQIAASLGSDEAAAERGIGAGVPGILAGLANAASTPGGAQKLGPVVSQIQAMPPEEIVRHLLDADHRKLAEPGWAMLSSLAGVAFLQTLSSSVARFSGLGQAAAKDLLGLLAPVVLEFLRREQIAKGLDATGMASLLASQRGNIRRALPREMALRLQGSDERTPGEPRASQTYRKAAAPAARRPSSGTRTFWVLRAIILAGVAISLLPMRGERPAAQYTDSNTTIVAKTTPGELRQPETGESAAGVRPRAGRQPAGRLWKISSGRLFQ